MVSYSTYVPYPYPWFRSALPLSLAGLTTLRGAFSTCDKTRPPTTSSSTIGNSIRNFGNGGRGWGGGVHLFIRRFYFPALVRYKYKYSFADLTFAPCEYLAGFREGGRVEPASGHLLDCFRLKRLQHAGKVLVPVRVGVPHHPVFLVPPGIHLTHPESQIPSPIYFSNFPIFAYHNSSIQKKGASGRVYSFIRC